MALGPGQAIEALDSLTSSEVEAFKLASRELSAFRTDDQLFEIFGANLNAFYSFLQNAVAAYSTDKVMNGTKIVALATESNRHLLNVSA